MYVVLLCFLLFTNISSKLPLISPLKDGKMFYNSSRHTVFFQLDRGTGRSRPPAVEHGLSIPFDDAAEGPLPDGMPPPADTMRNEALSLWIILKTEVSSPAR